MLIRKIKDCPEFSAGDGCKLREYLNPAKELGLALRYSLALAEVLPGDETKPHALTHSEVYYIIEGTGEMRVDEECSAVEADSLVYIPPKALQSIKNTGKSVLRFICMVDPAWTPACETVI
ncbi:MAG: cupin domain-containing protein [Candidatus Omnitrophica bacterium]|jgi:mannose-6-phosphate isomerase-like protein (cupin superfamily)|nr:cupin domain-containing protein [Candidatus Omnitrophota bacterium]